MLHTFFQDLWYGGATRWVAALLLPFSWLFGAIAALRRTAYRVGLLRSVRVSRPVIVIGNITVGGVGKTPLTIWLASQLAARGVRVGIILRGYGGRSAHWPRDVTNASAPEEVGDEAVLLASCTSAIVVAGPDRVADARRAIELGAEVVLSDDGLQHYRLARDCEIAVVDEQRGLGNGRLLPAGPLREPMRRLHDVDLVVMMRRTASGNPAPLELRSVRRVTATATLGGVVSLASGEARALESFQGSRIHAIAAIGHPQAFFDALAVRGLSVVDARALPDHAALSDADLRFDDDAPVLMTQKDAVKCRAFADPRLWAVHMDLDMSAQDLATVSGIVERAPGVRSSMTHSHD